MAFCPKSIGFIFPSTPYLFLPLAVGDCLPFSNSFCVGELLLPPSPWWRHTAHLALKLANGLSCFVSVGPVVSDSDTSHRVALRHHSGSCWLHSKLPPLNNFLLTSLGLYYPHPRQESFVLFFKSDFMIVSFIICTIFINNLKANLLYFKYFQVLI